MTTSLWVPGISLKRPPPTVVASPSAWLPGPHAVVFTVTLAPGRADFGHTSSFAKSPGAKPAVPSSAAATAPATGPVNAAAVSAVAVSTWAVRRRMETPGDAGSCSRGNPAGPRPAC